MATIEFARYTIDPAHADDLIEAALTRLDETTWMDSWRWNSHEEAVAAARGAPDVPEAAAMFSLITAPPPMEHGEVVAQA